MSTLPPGVSERTFGQAIQRFERAVGKQWVFTSDEDVGYLPPTYPGYVMPPEERIPSLLPSSGPIGMPGDPDQQRRILEATLNLLEQDAPTGIVELNEGMLG